VRLLDRADRVRLRGESAPEVFGGPGGDIIVGGSAFDELHGNAGEDTIRGAGGGDSLYGGGGPDRMLGGGGDDTLFDDRPDGPTSGDLFDGGPGGDAVDYSKRVKGLDIDLARRRVNNSSEGDLIVRVENVNGGRGPDRIAGTGRRNLLDGNGGDDRISGRGGRDFLQGGRGDDKIFGGAGGDLIGGDEGKDSLRGDEGNDTIDSTDRDTSDGSFDRKPDAVRCGEGPSDDMAGGPLDTVTDCEFAAPFDSVLRLAVQPQVVGDKATFTTTCDPETGDECVGTISLKSATGVLYGSGPFSVAETSGRKRVTFSVTLTAEGQAAVERGTVVAVAIRPDEDTFFEVVTAGYRTFMKTG
jgi:Ca2+-binding RTX toxin-like protein